MKITFRSAALSTLLIAGAAHAQEMKEGWGFQFRQDTFDKTIFPVAMMSQEGKDFDKALIAIACGPKGHLVSFFQAGMVSFETAAKVQLRDGDSSKEFTFTAADIPNMGKRLAADAKTTGEILAIFERANGADVAFRTDNKQGAFSSVASAKTFSILRQNCPSK